MKNAKLERLKASMRQFHRRHPWRLNRDGLFLTRDYSEHQDERFSWWDDFGFILNDRRIMVWWEHPRQAYLDALEDRAQSIIDAHIPPYPEPKDALVAGMKACHKRVGRSRKKVIFYHRPLPESSSHLRFLEYKKTLNALKEEGIEHVIRPSFRRERLPWAEGVHIVAPVEILSEQAVKVFAQDIRAMLLGQTRLDLLFPDNEYGKQDWLRERSLGLKP